MNYPPQVIAMPTALMEGAMGSSGERHGYNKAPKVEKKEQAEVPIFLRKTYHMVDTCDPSISCWSDDGETFIVKDPDLLATDVIPQFFKHNNFSSFVRQLNFYGFRKIKADPIKISPSEEDMESRYWRFRHDKFRRGRQDLLIEIRKTNQTQSVDQQQEIDTLRGEVKSLKGQMNGMSDEMNSLKIIVQTLLQERTQQLNGQMESMQAQHQQQRKRKRVEWTTPYVSPSPSPPMATHQHGIAQHVQLTGVPPSMPQDDGVVEAYKPGTILPVHPTGRLESLASVSSACQAMFDDVFDDAPSGANKAGAAAVTSSSVVPSHTDHMAAKLQSALSLLPKKLQEAFVERLVASITDPDSFGYHVDAVATLAKAAGDECQRHGSFSSLSLSAATLGAYLAEYASAVKESAGLQEHLHQTQQQQLHLGHHTYHSVSNGGYREV